MIYKVPPKYLVSSTHKSVNDIYLLSTFATEYFYFFAFYFIAYFFLEQILFTWCEPFIRELKIWRRQRRRQRHKSMIWLVEWRKIIVLHVQHAFWCSVLTQSAKRRREIFIFEVLTTTGPRSSKYFLLCLYTKTIRGKQAKVHSAYFVQRDQHGKIARDLT